MLRVIRIYMRQADLPQSPCYILYLTLGGGCVCGLGFGNQSESLTLHDVCSNGVPRGGD